MKNDKLLEVSKTLKLLSEQLAAFAADLPEPANETLHAKEPVAEKKTGISADELKRVLQEEMHDHPSPKWPEIIKAALAERNIHHVSELDTDESREAFLERVSIMAEDI